MRSVVFARVTVAHESPAASVSDFTSFTDKGPSANRSFKKDIASSVAVGSRPLGTPAASASFAVIVTGSGSHCTWDVTIPS